MLFCMLEGLALLVLMALLSKSSISFDGSGKGSHLLLDYGLIPFVIEWNLAGLISLAVCHIARNP